MLKKTSVCIFFILLVVFSKNTGYCKESNIFLNQGFESVNKNTIKNWEATSWSKEKDTTVFLADDKVFKSGSRSAYIKNNLLNDARYKQKINVESNSNYKISCWVKTKNIDSDKIGANISIEGITINSQNLNGTNDWTKLELIIKPDSGVDSVVVTFGIGGYASENVGEAWFDDVVCEKLDKLADGEIAQSIEKVEQNGNAINDKVDEKQNDILFDKEVILFFGKTLGAGILTFVLIFIIFKKIVKRTNTISQKHIFYILFGILILIGFIVRIYISSESNSHPYDISCFKAWSQQGATSISNIYEGENFIDYPPIYIFVLGVLGKVGNLLKIDVGSIQYIVFLKLPAILADLAIAYLIFKLSLKKFSIEKAVVISSLFVFNPLTITDNAFWGQIDSFFSLFVILSFIYLTRGKFIPASIFLMISIMTKPQGIIFVPILGFGFLKELYGKTLEEKKNEDNIFYALRNALKNGYAKRIIFSTLGVISVFVLAVIPYSLTYKKPLWFFSLISSTMGQYKFASLNAFNLFGFIGANWKNDEETLFLFSYHTWGMIYIVFVTSLIGIIYLYTDKKEFSFVASSLLMVGVFVFASRMHERYMYPVIPLLLFAYIYYRHVGIILFYIFATVTNFLNVWIVYIKSLQQDTAISNENILLKIVSFSNIILFASMVVAVVLLVKRETFKNDAD